MNRKHFTLGLFIFFYALLFQTLPAFGNNKLISLNGLPQIEEAEKTEQLIIQKLLEQGLNESAIPPCEITISNSPNGYKISTIVKHKGTARIHSYLPIYTMENLAEIAAQDLSFLVSAQKPVTQIVPPLNHYLQTKQIKRIFPQLSGDFIPTSLGFSGNNLIVFHTRGTLELSPRFQLNDQSAEDIYNWTHVAIEQSPQARKFPNFMICLKADNSGLEKIWFQPDKREKIELPLTNLDFIFSSQSWELSLIMKNQLIHINVHDFSQNTYPFSPGFITAATICDQGLWVYNSLDKRLHLYNREGLWLKSQRPQIQELQSPFALIILDDKSIILCDYGQIYGLDPHGKQEWTIKNYTRQGIAYSLPAFFYPALSPDNNELYILNFQAEELMHYPLKTTTRASKTDTQPNPPEKAITQWIEQKELLLAFQTLYANQNTMEPHQYQLQEKALGIALKKRICQGLLSRATIREANLNLQQAAELLTFYISEIKELQRLEPLNMELPKQYQKALEKRNQLLQRINRLTLQKPDSQDMALVWEQGPNGQVQGSLEIHHKRWTLPVTVTIKVPGLDTPISQTLKNREQMIGFIKFTLTKEIANHEPLSLSLLWPDMSREFLWSETLDPAVLQTNDE